jgi:glycosyltransferase involved in cell wall biosynthesis
MNIIFFINSLCAGGAERVAATLANHWARRQWQVTIVTLAPRNLDFYALEPAVARVGFDLAHDSANALEGLAVNMRRVAALRRVIRRIGPDVVLSMMSTPNVVLALASRGVNGLCAVGSEHCFPPKFPLGPIWERLRRVLYGRLSAVAALTGEGAEWIKAHTSAARVPVIPNPVSWPLQDGAPRVDPHTCCRSGRRILLAVGRLSPEKNFDTLIRVFAQLARRHPEWDLVILGEGPQRSRLEACVREEGVAGRVFLPGVVGNVGHWYGHADLFVLSSLFEGFPNALAEALVHGLPAVSVDCDTGPRDIVRHGVDGLLVPPGDAGALQAALEQTMADSELRERLAFSAYEARTRFSVERIADMWEDEFRRLGSMRWPHAQARPGVPDRKVGA